jgi:type I restriction enzyme S subunit
MNNITYGGELDLTDLKRVNIPDNELAKCTVRKGDVLFNRTNSKELVGKTCLYDRDETMVLAGFVIRVRMNEKATPEFLVQYMNLPYMKELLLSMCKAACGQANINAQELQNIPIYIPPIDIQKRFIVLKQQTDKSKFEIKKAIENTSSLIKSLMQQDLTN